MTFWDFAAASPFPALVMVFLLVMLVRSIAYRIARTISIWRHGWPPGPVDADGDSIKAADDIEEIDAAADNIASAVVDKLKAERDRSLYRTGYGRPT